MYLFQKHYRQRSIRENFPDIERGAITGFFEGHQDPAALFVNADEYCMTQNDRDPAEFEAGFYQIILTTHLSDPVISPVWRCVFFEDL